MQIHQATLEIVRGSVLEIEADAIVNAANTAMRGAQSAIWTRLDPCCPN